MIQEMLRPAYRLDAWLESRLGEPYRVVLGVGLVIGIVQSVRELPHKFGSGHGIIGEFLTLLLFAALLVNQLAELYQRVEARRERRAQRSQS
jgi:hypothetical protein